MYRDRRTFTQYMLYGVGYKEKRLYQPSFQAGAIYPFLALSVEVNTTCILASRNCPAW